METHQVNPIVQFGRNLYQSLPGDFRQRLERAPLIQGIRESVQNGDNIPYILLQEQHIANLHVVLNRNALLQTLPSNAVVAEVGVAEGGFSQRILKFANPSKLYLIDAWDEARYTGLHTTVNARLSGEIDTGRVEIRRGMSTAVLPTFDDHFFDWVFLDTDHTYATTRDELQICKTKVKPGGLICGHDYITGDWKMRNRYGVVEAVNEFCVKEGWEMVYVTHETHRHLSYALRKL